MLISSMISIASRLVSRTLIFYEFCLEPFKYWIILALFSIVKKKILGTSVVSILGLSLNGLAIPLLTLYASALLATTSDTLHVYNLCLIACQHTHRFSLCVLYAMKSLCAMCFCVVRVAHATDVSFFFLKLPILFFKPSKLCLLLLLRCTPTSVTGPPCISMESMPLVAPRPDPSAVSKTPLAFCCALCSFRAFSMENDGSPFPLISSGR